MTFFEKLLWLADAAMGKSTGGRSYFLRAAREQQHHLVKLDQQVLYLKLLLEYLPSREGGNGKKNIRLDTSATNLCVQRNDVAKFKLCVMMMFLDAKVLQKTCRDPLNGAQW